MFSRRTRSNSALGSRPTTPASATAHSAAAQAFLASRSNANLSAAAAAAALRTMSPTPTPVSQVQTKRTLQRQNSNSSNGSARGRGHGLQRQGSSGSMTERTFRSPSPHAAGGRKAADAPPVPPIPRTIASPPPLSEKQPRRAISMEPPPPRVLSPPLAKTAGRGASLDRGGKPAPARSAANKQSNLQDIRELERTDSQQSINFSYPRGSRPISPNNRSPTSPVSIYQNGASPVQNISTVMAEGIRYDMSQVAAQPVKKKKKKVVTGPSEGSHFHNSATNGKPTVTPLEPAPIAVATADTEIQAPQPIKKKKKKVALTGESTHFERDVVSPTPASDSDTTPEKVQRRAQRASGTLNKQPSVVREDWEGEQENNQRLAPDAQKRADQGLSPISSPSSAVQSKKPPTVATPARQADGETNIEFKPLSESIYASITTGPATTKQEATNKHLALANSESQAPRTTSLSPSRSMRFSDRLSSDLTAGKKHEPLGRSISPAKSALKHHSPAPSATSPVDAAFPSHVRSASQTPSEVSDINSTVSADGTQRRRKSARVSFDEEPEVVGTAAAVEQSDTPILASPQSKDASKKGWFGWKNKTSPLGTIPAEDDMEEIMKPRPDLPSFGSIRSKNRSEDVTQANGLSTDPVVQDVDTAPIVQDASTAPKLHIAATTSATSSEASASSNNQTLDTSVSSDHAIGGLIGHKAFDDPQQHLGQTRSEILPLPPQVTSVEGSGDISDTEGSVYSQDDQDPEEVISHPEQQKLPVAEAPSRESHKSEAVPSIAVQPATPALEKVESRPQDQFMVSIPGGFPSSAEQLSRITTPQSEQPVAQEPPVPDQPPSVQPTPETDGAQPPMVPEIQTGIPLSEAVLGQRPKDDDDESSAGDSIYSDAEEDVAGGGTGFGSINAIVESPVTKAPTYPITTPPDSPVSRTFGQFPPRPESSTGTASWDQAQAHWSGVAEAYRQGIQPQPSVPIAEKPKPKGLEDSIYAPKPKKTKASSKAGKRPMTNSSDAYQSAEPPNDYRQSPATRAVPGRGPPSSLPNSIYPQAPSERSSSLVQQSAYPILQSGRGSSPPQPPPMKKSMRSQADSEALPGLRSSMRTPPPAKSHSEQQPRQTSSPDFTGAVAPRTKAALQKKKIPPAAVSSVPQSENVHGATVTPNMPTSKPNKAAIQRTFSNDSDSESSFRKRHRRTGSGEGGSYSMRRSMRAPPATASEPSRPVQPGGRGGIRSVSPVMRRPFSPVGGQKTMRMSMRTPINSQAQPLRSSPGQKRSQSLFGRSKQGPRDIPPISRPVPIVSQVRSRFADSDDEDEAPRTFNSRFQDSDDDEPEPMKFRPVRGIPRKTDEGDSTDLDDSSEGEERTEKLKSHQFQNVQSSARPRTPLQPTVNTTQSPADANDGSVLSSEAMSPATAKKRGLWSRFSRRKVKDENARSKLGGTIADRNATLERTRPDVEAARAPENITVPRKAEMNDKSRPSRLGFASIAERDAVIERTRAQLEGTKAQLEESKDRPGPLPGSSTLNNTSDPQRLPPRRIMSDSWPLLPKIPTADEERPQTSDGVGLVETVSETNLMRPDLGVRNNTSSTVRSSGGTPVYSKRTGKKKKFPMLRRAFGLDD